VNGGLVSDELEVKDVTIGCWGEWKTNVMNCVGELESLTLGNLSPNSTKRDEILRFVSSQLNTTTGGRSERD
jgi:hypothetical protein